MVNIGLSALTGVIVASITFYQFVVRRPLLILHFQKFPRRVHADSPAIDDYARILPTFELRNYGGRFAEDIYLELNLNDWNTGATRSSAVNGSDSENRESADEDAKLEQTVLPTGPGIIVDESYDREDTELPKTDATLEESSVEEHPASAGERWDISLEGPLYPKDHQELKFGRLELEAENTYKATYRIACRSKRIRKGKILIKVGQDSIEITESHGSYYLYCIRLRNWAEKLVRDLWKQISARVWSS
jgi:hypothetical protein